MSAPSRPSARVGCLLALCALLPLAPACGWKCPAGGQGGSCDVSNAAPDPAAPVTKLSLVSGCDYVPTTSCAGAPGFTCTLGGGEQHRFGYAVIGTQQGWDKLAASWSAGCAPSEVPATWTDTFVILASVRATESTASSVAHTVHRQGNGALLVVLDFDMTYENDCDCVQHAALGLVVKASPAPAVCLKVKSTCK